MASTRWPRWRRSRAGWSSPASAGKTRPAPASSSQCRTPGSVRMTSRSSSSLSSRPSVMAWGWGCRLPVPSPRLTEDGCGLAATRITDSRSISCFRGRATRGSEPRALAQTRRVGAAPGDLQNTAEGLGRAGDHPLQLGITILGWRAESARASSGPGLCLRAHLVLERDELRADVAVRPAAISAWTAFALAWRLFPVPTSCSAARVELLLGRRLQRRGRRPEPEVARGRTDSDLSITPGRPPRVVGDAPKLERAPCDVDGHVLRLARMERDPLEPGEGTDGHRRRQRGRGADVNLRHLVALHGA